MANLKNNKRLRWLLVVILLILLVCYLPQEILFWSLCTEQDRDLPPNTEVLVSACKKPVASGVPGGEAVFVHEVRTGRMYLLDLHTGEERKVPNDSLLLETGVFLSSELIWLEGSVVRPGKSGYRPHYIFDLTDGKRYELLDLDTLPRLEDGKFDPKNYAYIWSAQYLYIHHSKNTLIALSSDFRTNPGGRVVFSGVPIGTDFGEALVLLMKEYDLDYENVDLSTTRFSEIPSPTGKYIVRNDGIYLLGTEIPFVTRDYVGTFLGGYFKGWYYDESAIVVQRSPDYLINDTILGTYIVIYNPILKLRLPTQ